MVEDRQQIDYVPLPTLKKFHESPAVHRCCIGPFGSGKTSAAIMEFGYYLPMAIFNTYGIKRTRWTVVRNTYSELWDTVKQPMFEDWIPWGTSNEKHDTYIFGYPNGVVVEFWFRACDRPDHAKKFKSLLTTGVWIEEASEVDPDVKRTLKGRIGRYPKLKKGEDFPLEFWLETSNPMEVEHEMFSMYKWIVEPPGVVPSKPPLADHDGFWQPPYENQSNLRPGYYDKLKERYRDSPEFYDMYVLGKPGSMVKGKLVYYDFTREKHVAKETLPWHKGRLYRGWDNTGNHPACVVLQLVSPNKIHILKEFHHDRMGILDFTQWVVIECNQLFEGASYTDYADPAGENKVASPVGGLTSNAEMMRDFGVNVIPSDQNWEARRESVQKQIGIEGGLLVDPSCTRTINGFISGYAYGQIGTTGTYKDRPMKNRYSDVHDSIQYALVKIFRSESGRANAIKMGRQQREHFKRLTIPGI